MNYYERCKEEKVSKNCRYKIVKYFKILRRLNSPQ